MSCLKNNFLAVRFFKAKTDAGLVYFAEDVEGRRTAISKIQYERAIASQKKFGKFAIVFS